MLALVGCPLLPLLLARAPGLRHCAALPGVIFVLAVLPGGCQLGW